MKPSDWNRSTQLSRPIHRAVTVLLLLTLLLGIPGCGGDTTTTPTATPTPTSIVTTTTAPPTAPATPAATTVLPRPGGELPIVDELVTLRILVAQSPRILSYQGGENAFTTWLEERTGVKVELI